MTDEVIDEPIGATYWALCKPWYASLRTHSVDESTRSNALTSHSERSHTLPLASLEHLSERYPTRDIGTHDTASPTEYAPSSKPFAAGVGSEVVPE